jgi:hypothetical protein
VILTVFGPVLVMLMILSGILISPAGREYVQGILNDPNVQEVIGDPTIGSLVQASLRRRLINPWTFLVVGGLLGWALALCVGGVTRRDEETRNETKETKEADTVLRSC